MERKYRRSNRQKYRKRRQQVGFTATVSLVVIILGGLLFFGVNPTNQQQAGSEELVVDRTETPTVAQAPDPVAEDESASVEDEAATEDEAAEEAAAEEEAADEPSLISVPDIPYNASEDEARRMLEDNDLELGAVEREPNNDYDEGGVFLQNPLPNEEVEEGSEVGITLSDGPAERESSGDGDIPDPGTTDLYLTAEKMGLVDDYVVNDASEATLLNGAGKIPETGFPWQPSANTYIASHILGYAGTGSQNHFAGLLNMTYGDRATLTDTNGTEYTYEVTEILTVTPYDVWVTEPQAGRDMMTLQTCVNPPAYDMRLVVHFDRVDVNVAA